MGTNAPYTIECNGQPVVAVALHGGHELRSEVADILALNEQQQFKEEDPYTDAWTDISSTRVVVRRSRFEVDLNRERDDAVYRCPEDCWGMQVWSGRLPSDLVERSLRIHDSFYSDLRHVLEQMEKDHGRFIVYDLHNYNHRRNGPDSPPAYPEDHPEVNLGTGSVNCTRWGHVVQTFVDSLRSYDFQGRSLDVRENVRFKGRYLPRWVHETFPETGCVLAIDIKKFFMDEHTGELDEPAFKDVRRALEATVEPVIEALGRG